MAQAERQDRRQASDGADASAYTLHQLRLGPGQPMQAAPRAGCWGSGCGAGCAASVVVLGVGVVVVVSWWW